MANPVADAPLTPREGVMAGTGIRGLERETKSQGWKIQEYGPGG